MAEGYAVVTAHSGTTALELLQNDCDFNMMITDIAMPGQLQGNDLADIMRENHPEIGIIFMSDLIRLGTHGFSTESPDIFRGMQVSDSEHFAALDSILNANAPTREVREPQFS